MTETHWEHFPHEADMGVRGLGTTLEEAFEQAAMALTAVIIDPYTVAPQEVVEISCEAPDVELLFADWLNALVYEMATRKLLFACFEVHLNDHQLWGRAWGEPINPDRHHPAVEVKGATYTALQVGQTEDGGWLAQCVVDVWILDRREVRWISPYCIASQTVNGGSYPSATCGCRP